MASRIIPAKLNLPDSQIGICVGCRVDGRGLGARWWDGDWPLRKLITVDTTATGVPITEPIGSSPVLIRLHDGDFRFSYAKPDGTDLRFVAADDKTLLAYHIEKFDSLLNEAFVWVNVPGLKPGTKTSYPLRHALRGREDREIADLSCLGPLKVRLSMRAVNRTLVPWGQHFGFSGAL